MARNPQNIERHKFKPGQSGNPNGRPKKIPNLEKIIGEVLGDEDDPDSKIRKIVETLADRAIKRGDTRAVDILFDRLAGKAKQSISFEDTNPVRTIILDTGRRKESTADK